MNPLSGKAGKVLKGLSRATRLAYRKRPKGIKGITRSSGDRAVEVWMAALCGAPELALEIERLGGVGEDDSLALARELRPLVFAGIAAATDRRGGRNG